MPASLKEKMDRIETNWNKEIRELISERIEEEDDWDMAEAVVLNERVRRRAPEGWNALSVIKQWRRRKNA